MIEMTSLASQAEVLGGASLKGQQLLVYKNTVSVRLMELKIWTL